MANKRRTLASDAQYREKIQTGVLLNLVENHALGLVELTQTRLKAADMLLKKTLPDIQMIQVDVEGGIDINVLQVASHPPAKKRASKPASK